MNFSNIAAALDEYDGVDLNRTIDPNDVMWTSGPDWYWSVGRSGLDCVLRGLLESPLSEPRSVLDLACGYGRVGRHLVACFPEASFFWCDVEGADFCAEHFGGEALLATRNLLDTPLPKVDVVWIGSLFTHLTEARTRAWLQHVAASLNDGGIIVATFHGRSTGDMYRRAKFGDMMQLGRVETEASARGWGFEAYDAARDPEWGFSWTRLSRLAEIAAAVPQTRVVGLIEGGWAANHDVLTLLRTATT
jgi:SAM-dependent methyltransferase